MRGHRAAYCAAGGAALARHCARASTIRELVPLVAGWTIHDTVTEGAQSHAQSPNTQTKCRFGNRGCLVGKQGVAAGIKSQDGGDELTGCMLRRLFIRYASHL